MEEKVNQLGFIFIKLLTIIIISFRSPKSDFCYGILPFYTGKRAKAQHSPAPTKTKEVNTLSSPAHPTLSPAPAPAPAHWSPPPTRPCPTSPRPQARAGLRPRPFWRLSPSHVRLPSQRDVHRDRLLAASKYSLFSLVDTVRVEVPRKMLLATWAEGHRHVHFRFRCVLQPWLPPRR